MPNTAPQLGNVQNFTTGTGDFQSFNGSGTIVNDGNGYAIVGEGVGPNGPFTRFGGYSSEFVDHSATEVKVFINAGWNLNEGFQYSVAANGSDGVFQRDHAFIVRSDGAGSIQIGVANGATQTPYTADLSTVGFPSVSVTQSGFYTLQQVFNNVGGFLSVDMNLIAPDGTITLISTLGGNADPIAEVGGNRYGWFTDVSVAGGLTIDDVKLGDFDGNVRDANGARSASGAIPFTDIDVSDLHAISAAPVGANYVGVFTPTVSADSTGDGYGAVTWTFNASASDLAPLGEGQTVTQTYNVSLIDGQGGISTQVVTIQITGTDPLTLTGGTITGFVDTSAQDDFPVTEGNFDTDRTAAGNNSTTVSGSTTGGTGAYTYAVTGAGASNIVVNNVVVGTEITNAYGRLVVATNGNYQFVPNDSAINALQSGSNPVANFSIRVTDGANATSTATYSINLTGASDTTGLTGGVLATYNDTPAADTFAVRGGGIDTDPTSNVATGTVGNLTGDVDFGRSYGVLGGSSVVVNGQSVGTELTGQYGRLVVANTGRYQYVPNDAAINGVGVAGATDTFNVFVRDSSGIVTSAAFSVNINGAQDVTPVLTGGTIANILDTSGNDTFGVIQGNFDTDVSGGNTGTTVSGSLNGGVGPVSYALTGSGVTPIVVGNATVGYEVTGTYGTFRLASDGRYQFVPNSETIDTLPSNTNPVLSYSVQVTDANGVQSTATYAINIDGATDNTVVTGGVIGSYADTAANDSFAVIQGSLDTNPTDATNAGATGTLTGDIDATRAFYLSSTEDSNVSDIQDANGNTVGTQISTEFGQLILATDGRYQFVPNSAGINALGQDQTQTLTFSFYVADLSNFNENYPSSTLTINLTGAHDTAPVLSGDTIATYYDSDNNFFTATGKFDTDVNTANNSYDNYNEDGRTGALEGGTGLATYALTGPGVTTITANGLTVAYETTSPYGLFRVGTDGTYSFTPNEAAINSLGDNDHPTVTFAVQVTDGGGLQSTANYTVDIVGAFERPVINEDPATPYSAELTETNAPLSYSGQVEAMDVPGNTLTYSHTNDYSFENNDSSKGFGWYGNDVEIYSDGVGLTDAQASAIAAAFSVNAQTGEYTFNLASPDFLDPGQSIDVQYLVHVTNQLGEESIQDIDIHIDGTIETGPAGTIGDDTLTGGAFGDAINGGSGDDVISGLGGNDVLSGGSSDDDISGGAGDDTLRGNSGDDLLTGGSGFNILDGGSGTDTAVFGYDYYSGDFYGTGPNSGYFYSYYTNEATQVSNVENFQFADGSVYTFQQLFG